MFTFAQDVKEIEMAFVIAISEINLMSRKLVNVAKIAPDNKAICDAR